MKYTTNKYRNVKTVYDGIKFDSQKEANKYWQLKHDPMVKKITLQPKFEIIKGFSKDGIKYRATYYRADFEVDYVNGTKEIIDIKPFNKRTGEYFLTPLFRLKAKLFDLNYPHLTLVIE